LLKTTSGGSGWSVNPRQKVWRLSGTGANTVGGKTEAKGPGSLIYEPYGLVHQWGNPGNEPLTFVSFNINQEGVAAVLPGTPARTQ